MYILNTICILKQMYINILYIYYVCVSCFIWGMSVCTCTHLRVVHKYIHIHIYIWLYIIFQYVDIYVLYFLGRGMHRSKTALWQWKQRSSKGLRYICTYTELYWYILMHEICFSNIRLNIGKGSARFWPNEMLRNFSTRCMRDAWTWKSWKGIRCIAKSRKPWNPHLCTCRQKLVSSYLFSTRIP